MRGSEKISPSKFIKSKYIKEATLELMLWGGFFVQHLCNTVEISMFY
jgi:hypothetical protein